MRQQSPFKPEYRSTATGQAVKLQACSLGLPVSSSKQCRLEIVEKFGRSKLRLARPRPRPAARCRNMARAPVLATETDVLL